MGFCSFSSVVFAAIMTGLKPSFVHYCSACASFVMDSLYCVVVWFLVGFCTLFYGLLERFSSLISRLLYQFFTLIMIRSERFWGWFNGWRLGCDWDF